MNLCACGCGKSSGSRGLGMYAAGHYDRSKRERRRLSSKARKKLSIERRGPGNPMWKGDRASAQSGRERAVRLFPFAETCSCGNPRVERHHKDGNTLNNSPENVQMLCRRCHMKADGRLAEFQKMAARPDRVRDSRGRYIGRKKAS